jgi:Flp pilus assembly protein TadG
MHAREAAEMVGMGKRHKGERGASLVEFALIMPLLILLIFGMVDASWAFFQNLEVRHGARESARLAVVNFGDEAAIIAETCARMNDPGSSVQITVASDSATIGGKVTVNVTKAHDAIVAFMPFFDGITLSSTVEMRLEQNLSVAYPGAGGTCP